MHCISLPKASQVAAVKGKKVSEYKPQYLKALDFKEKKKKKKERRGDEKDKGKKRIQPSTSKLNEIYNLAII